MNQYVGCFLTDPWNTVVTAGGIVKICWLGDPTSGRQAGDG